MALKYSCLLLAALVWPMLAAGEPLLEFDASSKQVKQSVPY